MYCTDQTDCYCDSDDILCCITDAHGAFHPVQHYADCVCKLVRMAEMDPA